MSTPRDGQVALVTRQFTADRGATALSARRRWRYRRHQYALVTARGGECCRRSIGASALVQLANVADEDAVTDMMAERSSAASERIDILVNSASIRGQQRRSSR